VNALPPRERTSDTGKGWRLNVTVLPSRFAVCKLDALAPAPEWGLRGPFGAITRTESELCVICPERDVPPTVERTSGWRALRIAGQLDHAHASGVLLTAAEPLARAGIPIFPVTASASGFVFVREEHLARAIETLAQWGHQIREIST
jgi:hypothetical protein